MRVAWGINVGMAWALDLGFSRPHIGVTKDFTAGVTN
jgi:hypothetical protein